MQLAVDYSQYSSDDQKSQFNDQIVSDVSASLGISPTMLSVTSVVDNGNGKVTVNFLITGTESASLAGQLLGMISNTSSPLYDPSRQLTSNTLPDGESSTGEASNGGDVNEAFGVSIGAWIGIGLGFLALIAFIVVAACYFKKRQVHRKTVSGISNAASPTQVGTPKLVSSPVARGANQQPENQARLKGWTKVWDESTKSYYYFNTGTNESIWTPPAGWVDSEVEMR
jgi:hypothetical protein